MPRGVGQQWVWGRGVNLDLCGQAARKILLHELVDKEAGGFLLELS